MYTRLIAGAAVHVVRHEISFGRARWFCCGLVTEIVIRARN